MRLPLVLILILIGRLGFSQANLVDNLYKELKNHSQEDTFRVALLNQLSFRVLKSQPQQSLDYAKKALALSSRLGFENGIGEAKNNLAVYQLLMGNADQALALALEAVKIGEDKHLTTLLANSYAILGTIYHNQLDYTKALSYLAKAQKLNLKINNAIIASKIFNSLGGIARDKKKYDSALFYYQKALAVMKEEREEYRVPEVLNNMGIIYIRQNRRDLAMEYYHKAIERAKESDNRRAQALALSNIGGIFLAEKKYPEAERILLEALSLSKKIGDMKSLSGDYMWLGQLKNETGKFDEAHVYLGKFYELKDSLQSIEKEKKIAELEIRYETEKKENAILALEQDKKIQQLWLNILLVVLALIAVLSVSIYYLQVNRERKKRHILNLEIDLLTSQNKDISEKYKELLISGGAKSIESVDQRLLKKAIEVVENNMSDPLFGVEQLAKELAMSRTNMLRKIKAITGFPPSELIRNIRLRKAASMLLNQADTVSQIGFTVGFEDHSYFSKSFKKQFGVAPSDYFQSMRQMAN